MKRLAIMVTAVLIVSLAICTAGLTILNRTLDRAHAMTMEICMDMEQGNEAAAKETLVKLANYWKDHLSLLEVFCDHDDLHEVQERIIQAEICVRYTDMEDFYASVMLIGEGLEHICDEEALRISNLY